MSYSADWRQVLPEEGSPPSFFTLPPFHARKGFVMRAFQGLFTLVAIAAIAFGCWWFFARQTGMVPLPAQVFQAKPIPVSKTFTVDAGRQITWTLPPPQGKTPGTFQGQWSSCGKSAGIKRATDDTLVGFRLLGPNSNTIQSLDHPTSGNFSARYDGSGSYTLVFDNSGFVRSSAREVTLSTNTAGRSIPSTIFQADNKHTR